MEPANLAAIAAIDPIEKLQVYARRAGSAMGRAAAAPPGSSAGERQNLDADELEKFLESGRREAAGLATLIEDQTGESVDGRVMLDYGCGPGRLALPFAQRCKHVYGLELQSELLDAAAANAARVGASNVEWRPSTDLAALAGTYDAFVSMWVFQHIPSREGERILAQLVGGLRPGGVGVFNFAVRPARPIAGLRRGPRGRADLGGYAYHLVHALSFSRVGEILVDATVNEWHTRWLARRYGELIEEDRRLRNPIAMLVLRKPE